MKTIELRSNKVALASNSEGLIVSGYVNKPGALSEVLGTAKKFREKITPGAFKRAIENRSKDIDFLAEHDSKQVLASTRNESLTLREDGEGLYMEAQISPTTYGKDYYQLISDGLVRNMSFGFTSLKDSWNQVGGVMIRTIEELELFEVSAVRNPAYSQSSLAARDINLIEEIKVPEMEQLKDERGNHTMMKMEKRSNDIKAFEQYLREGTESRELTTTANGTAVIPENVSGTIVKKMEEVSPAFAQARKIYSVSGSLKVPREADGITGGFWGEGEEILEEMLNFEEVKLEQKRLGAGISLSNQLANDAGVDIVAYSQDLLSRRLSKTAEHAIFVGDGKKEFKGILSETDIATVEAEKVEKMTPLLELYTSIHPDFISKSAFYMNRNLFNAIAKIEDGNGHPYIQNGAVNGVITYTLFGAPVYVTQALPESTPAVFGDIQEAYTILVKKEMSILNVIDTANALRGSRLLVADAYMDGAVTNPQAIARLNVVSA
ncbi:phage major capsid protein [Bacillus pseudomycoides]|uniref:phage major capsid protein n=1 Tax=Bacillus pseudomycoides TaxID=64104 RepID=UPI000BF0BCDF|nr:phage major capsid protein [Bacillus pseudomycoides]PEI43567.1 phage major capsid protein [Bacillus pseudomycoides]